MMTAMPAFYLALVDQVRIDLDEGGVRVSTDEQSVAVRRPAAFLARALQRLANEGASEDSLQDEALETSESSALFSLLGVLQALDQRGFLKRNLVASGVLIAAL